MGRWATVSFPEMCLSTCTPYHPVICQARQAGTFQGLLLRPAVRVCTRGGGVLTELAQHKSSAGTALQKQREDANVHSRLELVSNWRHTSPMSRRGLANFDT